MNHLKIKMIGKVYTTTSPPSTTRGKKRKLRIRRRLRIGTWLSLEGGIGREILCNYIEISKKNPSINGNKNTTYQNLWDTTKEILIRDYSLST